MAYFPDVIPGQRISHSALLENNIRHVVNAFNGYGSNSVSYGVQRQNNTVSVYNTAQTSIVANTAVSFVSCAENILGVVPYNGSDVFGITASNIDVNSVGSAVISGCVFVACSGSGTKASPQI